MGCTVQPSNAQRQPKKDSALSPAEKLKHLWEAQCFSVFQALLGLPTFLPLCFPMQALQQTDFKSSPSDPGAREAVPPRLPGTHPGGDMYLSKWALVSESQPGTLLSSQGEWGDPENNVKQKDLSHTFLNGGGRGGEEVFLRLWGLLGFQQLCSSHHHPPAPPTHTHPAPSVCVKGWQEQ